MSFKLVIDTETTGLPKKPWMGGRQNIQGDYDFENLEDFDSARMLSISWILLDGDYRIVERSTHYVLPDNFDVPAESTQIHGLTLDYLEKHGKPVLEVLGFLQDVIEEHSVAEIIAHNVEFDCNVILSELFRYSCPTTASMLENFKHKLVWFCTMKRAWQMLGFRPSLANAYKHFCKAEITHAHDAAYDCLHCFGVYLGVKLKTTVTGTAEV